MIHQLLTLTRPLFCLDTETTGVDTDRDRIVEIGFQEWTAEGMVKEYRTLVNPGVPIPAAVTEIHHITDEMVKGCAVCGKPIPSMISGMASACHSEPNDPPHELKRWPSFKQLAANLAKGFADCDYAGQNVRFDLRILAAEMKRAGVEWSYAGTRIVDSGRLEALAVPRALSDLYKKYVRRSCDECDGRGEYLDAPGNVLDGRAAMTKCPACDGIGTIGMEHDGAHGALADVKASVMVIAKQLEAHIVLPRNLDQLHEAQWPGWLTVDGGFRMVDGVACILFGKHRGKAMKDVEPSYWDWMLKNDFAADAKALASAAKLRKFPEGK